MGTERQERQGCLARCIGCDQGCKPCLRTPPTAPTQRGYTRVQERKMHTCWAALQLVVATIFASPARFPICLEQVLIIAMQERSRIGRPGSAE